MRYAYRFTAFVLFLMLGVSLHAQEDLFEYNKTTSDDEEGMVTPNEAYRYSWPIVSVGAGATFYTGGLRSPRDLGKFNGARWGMNAQVEQRFGKYLGGKFNLFYGLAAGERHTFQRFDNFQSRMVGTDLRMMFHFDHILGKKRFVTPYIGIGIGYLNYRTKSDLKNAQGLTYYLWDDGSLRDQSQSIQTNGNPKELRRDFTYETTIVRSGNSITFPVEAGLRFKLHDYFDFGMGYTHYLMLTRFMEVKQNKKLDNFGYASATIYWYLGQFNQ